MPTCTSWRVLQLDRKEVPKLLVKSGFDTSGYEIQLTDLSHIWRESLYKAEIIQRAIDAGSAIDPGQDDEQLKIFLGKIESALNGEGGTSLSLEGGEPNDSSLHLATSATLPRPLPPFTWTISLQLLPTQDLENQLVTPLLLQASHLRHQIEQLVSELQDKDRVISKICDRLETSGNDLTTVFPGVSNIPTSRKKGQREQLARHVKGLADFDENAWRRQQARKEGDGGLEADWMDEVLRDLPLPTSACSHVLNDWWKHLGHESESRMTEMDSAHSRVDQETSWINGTAKPEDESMQDEFQRQSTPPNFKRHAPPVEEVINQAMPEPTTAEEKQLQRQQSAAAEDDDSTTDEDDDLDAAPSKPAPSQKPKPATPEDEQNSASITPRKLGMIGGRSPQPPSSPAKESTPPKLQPEPKPRPKLGMIGGKVKTSEPPLSNQETVQAGPSPPPRASKLGVIGGKRTTRRKGSPAPRINEETDMPDSMPAQDEPVRPSRTPAKEDTPQPRETSQERADRKRNQLKRELEERSKVSVKKKRKF